MCAPAPPEKSLRAIRQSPQPEISMSAILFVINKFNEKEKMFTLTKKACDFFDEFYDNCYEIVKICRNFDTFLSAMFGKSATHLLRLSGILHMLKKAIFFLNSKQICDREKRVLTNEFIQNVEKEFEAEIQKEQMENPDDDQEQENFPEEESKELKNLTKIYEETVRQAHELLIYFNKNRLVLAGYLIDLEIDFNNSIKQYIENSKNANKIENISYSKNQLYLFEKILCYPGLEVSAKQISELTRKPLSEFIDACKELEKLKFGTVIEFKCTNKKTTFKFSKRNLEILENDINFISIFKKLSINFESFKKSYTAEIPEQNSQKQVSNQVVEEEIMENGSQDISKKITPKGTKTKRSKNDEINKSSKKKKSSIEENNDDDTLSSHDV
ncbi:unnamed protein product [Brachionus calyciflorus]|uniref:Uncharacterized protein n=1 Tax=Brachionus calyciflorus TaxID=104777 RepID=A0A814N207_9BILA|nr:unnamed protein product [Brachionus calyciflorus]